MSPRSIRAEAIARAHAKPRLNRKASEPVVALPFITISRQFGCVAYSLAEAIVQRLNYRKPQPLWEVYDNRLLEELIERENLPAELVKKLTVRTRNVMEDILMEVIGGTPTEIDIFKRLARTITAIAVRGHTILIGRGAGIITRKLPGGIHLRLIASPEWRLRNIKQLPDRSTEATLKNLKRHDAAREQFIRYYLHADIDDPKHYQLIFNTELLTLDEQVELVASLVELKEGKAKI